MIKVSALIMSVIIIVFIISCGGDSTTLLVTDSGSNGEGNITVSGKVVDYNGDGIPGALVSLNDSSTETESSGEYIFAEIKNGSYNVIVSKNGYTFLPESRDIAASGSDVSVEDFIGLTGTVTGGHNGEKGYCAKCH